jgi:hypothetical protein
MPEKWKICDLAGGHFVERNIKRIEEVHTLDVKGARYELNARLRAMPDNPPVRYGIQF